jgi:hypothetical protein
MEPVTDPRAPLDGPEAAQLERLREMQERARRRQNSRMESAATQKRLVSEPAGWADPERPPGSVFTLEQWKLAREAHANCSVFEFHCRPRTGAPIEAALMAIPHERMEQQGLPAQLLDGSLVAQDGLQATRPPRSCKLLFCYRAETGEVQTIRMALYMRCANPSYDLFDGSSIKMAFGVDSTALLETPRQGNSPAGK